MTIWRITNKVLGVKGLINKNSVNIFLQFSIFDYSEHRYKAGVLQNLLQFLCVRYDTQFWVGCLPIK